MDCLRWLGKKVTIKSALPQLIWRNKPPEPNTPLVMKYLIIALVCFSTSVNSFSQSFSSLVAFVTDKDSGLPISNASIVVKEAGWSSKTTGSDGKAFFDKSMPIGEIRYIVSKDGYQGIEGTFNITTVVKSNTLNIKLSKFRDDRLLITGEVVDEDERDLQGAIVEVKVANIVRTATTDASGNYNWINSVKVDSKKRSKVNSQKEVFRIV